VTDAIGVTIVLDSLKTRPIKVLKRLDGRVHLVDQAFAYGSKTNPHPGTPV